jgi:hypothetical protein
MTSTVPRRRRLTAISLAGGLAVFALLIPALAGLVSAHNYTESLTCNVNHVPTLKIQLSFYAH